MEIKSLVQRLAHEQGIISESLEEIESQIIERLEYYRGFIVERPHERKVDRLPVSRKVIGPVVYFLLDDDHVDYVGQTINLQQRIGSHRKEKEFNFIAWVDVYDPNDLLIIEGLNIDYHYPPLNKTCMSMDSIIKKIANRIAFF